MKFSNTQEKQLHHPVIEGSRSPRWTNSNWTVLGCSGRFYPVRCQRSWNNSKLSTESYEGEPVFGKSHKVPWLIKSKEGVWRVPNVTQIIWKHLISKVKRLRESNYNIMECFWGFKRLNFHLIFTFEILRHKFQGAIVIFVSNGNTVFSFKYGSVK